MSRKQVDLAIQHFIEANCHSKAIEAALNSRQWAKAKMLADNIDPEAAKPFYRRLARHYEDSKQFLEAEKYAMLLSVQ